MTQALHTVGVAGVIVDDQGRALVVRRRENGHLESPGGILERNETILDGLRREISEETGLEVEVGRLSGVYKSMSRGIVTLVFRCERRAGALTLNAEVSEFRWMHADEIRRELDEAYAVRVVDAMADQAPVVRSHDGRSLLPTGSQRRTS